MLFGMNTFLFGRVPAPLAPVVRRLLLTALLASALATAAWHAAADDAPATPDSPAPGHSLHGESFSEGPRRRLPLTPGCGVVRFPVTTASPEAQSYFEQGVGQLHGFWYWEAERSFRTVLQIDPACVMAHWGMAMANIQNEARARQIIARVPGRPSTPPRRARVAGEPTTFHNDVSYLGERKNPPHDLMLNSKTGFGGLFGPMLAYDGLIVDGLNLDGIKARLSTGGAKGAESSGSFSEGEVFSYLSLPADINLAGRIYAATTTQTTVGGVYYLGGFDSVRGLPDGVHYGNKIAYGNFEARIIAARFKYAHIQPAIFWDTGSAWMNGHSPYKARETSIGGGFRIAVPQVYRLVLRVDYGVSVGNTKSRGLSIGLNQFFQPYKMVF
jgi:hypothetical protein